MGEPENVQREKLEERWKHLPASVRDPSRQRLDASVDAGLDADGEDDEDLEFIATLAAEATQEVQKAPQTPAKAARRFEVQVEDQLDMFRNVETRRRRPRVLETVVIEDVDMDDLVQQLATTAAALRQRRAA